MGLSGFQRARAIEAERRRQAEEAEQERAKPKRAYVRKASSKSDKDAESVAD